MADNNPPWVTTPIQGSTDQPPWMTSSITNTPGPTSPKPKPRIQNVGRGLSGAYLEAGTHGLLMQPLRWVHEGLDLGGYRKRFEQKFPGKSEEWYDQQVDRLYDEAIKGSRQQATKMREDNPYPGQTVGNFAAGVLGSAGPDWLIAPGVGLSRQALTGSARQVASNVARHATKQAAIQGTVGGAADLVTQGMDIAEGMQDGIDTSRLGTSAAFGAGFGAGFAGVQAGIHHPRTQAFIQESNAPQWVKSAFTDKANSPDDPPFKSQVGQEMPTLTPEQRARQREVFATGTKDDINTFFDEVGGPRPNDKSLDEWMEVRSEMEVPAAPKPEVIARQAHKDAIRAHMDNATKKWKNRPKINIYDSLDEMTPEMRESAKAGGITPDNTVGIYGIDGQVHLFAGQIKTPEAANAVLFHEGLGHFGLAERFGKKLDSVLQTLVTRNVGQFGKKVDEWQKKYPKAYGGDRLRAAEEVLAEMSEAGPLPKAIGDAVVSAIRQFGRTIGADLKYSDTEIKHILAMAHDAVINGKGRDVIANRFGGLAYQATDFGESEPNRQMYAGVNSHGNIRVPIEEWFDGPDGNARYEINDRGSVWDEALSQAHPGGTTLPEVLHHPELFKAYPELKEVGVLRRPLRDGVEAEFNNAVFPTITISPHALDPHSTVLHEIQHWIQTKEGWQGGGNTGMFEPHHKGAIAQLQDHYREQLKTVKTETSKKYLQGKIDKAQQLIDANDELVQANKALKNAELKDKSLKIAKQRIQDEMQQVNSSDDMTRPAVEARLAKREELNKKLTELTQLGFNLQRQLNELKRHMSRIKESNSDLAFDYYTLLHGEVEARDVQKRFKMTKAERENIAPFTAEGIKPGNMIQPLGDRFGPSSQQTAMGDELVDPNLLDTIDRLKQDPRFWSDPEFRKNVIELARSRTTPSIGPDESAIPASSGFKSEAEARAAQSNVQMTPDQLRERLAEGTSSIDQIERTYNRVYADYEKTYRSDAEVRRAATAAGFSPAKVKSFKDMEDLSIRIYRAQEAAKVLDERLAKLAEKEGTPDWSARDADNARKIIADHFYILTKLYDDKSELARAMRVAKMGYTHAEIRAYKEMLAEEGGTLSGLADDETLNRFLRSFRTVNQGGANPNGTNALIRGLAKPNWEEYLLSARVNMMLSGMSTHVTAITDMIDGIGYDLMDATAGLIPSLGREGLRALGLPVKPGIHPAEVGARYWGILRAAMEASTYVNALQTLKHGSSRHTSGGRQYARIPILSKVGDMIAAEDQFFRAFSTNMHLYGLGVRKAVEEARQAGKKPSFDDLITAGSNYARNPDSSMLTQAQRAAEESLLLAPNLLVNPLDALRRTSVPDPNATPGEKAANAAQRGASFLVSFMLPFVRTATNSLYQRIWRRTPLTLLDPRTIADLNSGGPKADIAMGRIMLGGAAVAIAWSAAGKGIVSGEGPDNRYKRDLKMATGWRPKSVKVEDEDGTRFNINQNLGNRLNPFDMNSQVATMVASAREAWDKGANKGQVLTQLKLATYSSVKSLLDNAWLGDLSGDIETFTAPGQYGVDRRDQWLANQVASFTPNLVAQIARQRDQGQPFTTVSDDLGATIDATVRSRIPGLREQLPDRMTPFGKPIQSGTSLAGQSTGILPQGNRFTGGSYVEQTKDEAELEIARLDDLFEETIVTPVRRTVKIDGENVKLTNEQFSEYQELAGREIVETLRDQMGTDEWSAMSDEERAAWINKMQKAAKKRVREYLFNGEPE